MSSKNRSMPSLHSDEAAEDFVVTTDLIRYDLTDSRDQCTPRYLPAVCESVPLIARVVAGGAGYPCRGWRPMPSCPVSPGLDLQTSFGLRPRFFSGRRVTGASASDTSEGSGVSLTVRPSPISCARAERRAA
ncbi:hypothetical protein KOEU_30770 [Komagataeibacter europaeus]|uniref:Uncharacterized protein n=1 Tax=Komagataeibacter europaeus TaxID=33995 RepID=A0A0M0EEV7_KOMEU|nr:hypothetical protein KOEU_30770 [Komagataeibacter europaeus]